MIMDAVIIWLLSYMVNSEGGERKRKKVVVLWEWWMMRRSIQPWKSTRKLGGVWIIASSVTGREKGRENGKLNGGDNYMLFLNEWAMRFSTHFLYISTFLHLWKSSWYQSYAMKEREFSTTNRQNNSEYFVLNSSNYTISFSFVFISAFNWSVLILLIDLAHNQTPFLDNSINCWFSFWFLIDSC